MPYPAAPASCGTEPGHDAAMDGFSGHGQMAPFVSGVHSITNPVLLVSRIAKNSADLYTKQGKECANFTLPTVCKNATIKSIKNETH